MSDSFRDAPHAGASEPSGRDEPNGDAGGAGGRVAFRRRLTSQGAGRPAARPPVPFRWGWLGRLAGFGALFLAITFLVLVGFTLLPGDGGGSSSALNWWVVLPGLAGAVAATWLLAVGVDRRSFAWLGLGTGGRAAGELLLGTLAGLVIVGATVLALALTGWASWSSVAGAGLGALGLVEISLLILAAAFTEELLSRGYPFRVLEERFGPAVALGATSIGFGLLHGGNPGVPPIALGNLTLAGVLLGAAYMRTRSLWFAGGLHFGWNWLMAASGLSVSGIDIEAPPDTTAGTAAAQTAGAPSDGPALPSLTGLEPTVTGPQVWTGGDFGPEGGLIATLVTILAIIWFWPRTAFAAASAAGGGQGAEVARGAGAEPGTGTHREDETR